MRAFRFCGWFIFYLLLPAAGWASGALYVPIDLRIILGDSVSAATGLSANGLVVGSCDAAGASSQAFLWTPGPRISVLNTGSAMAFGMGVNSLGTVVGYGFDATFSNYRAFVGDDSNIISIPTLPGGSNNAATAISDSGIVAGYSDAAGGAIIGFLYIGGTVISLGTLPGGSTSVANAINSSGVIAGQADAADGSTHAVMWSGGWAAMWGSGWTDLGVLPGYQSGRASAISSNGLIAGTLEDGLGGASAFLWRSGSMMALGALSPGGTSRAYGVNSSGTVVGTSDGSAFSYDGTALHDLNTLLTSTSSGWILTEADAINDSGQIAGVGYYNGDQQAFLLDSIYAPAPAVRLLFSGGPRPVAARGCQSRIRARPR